MIIKPPALKPGDTVAIIAPSRWLADNTLAQAKAAIETAGFTVLIHEQNNERHHEWAGDFATRAAALHDVFQDDRIKAVIAAAGGTRTLNLLEYIDFSILQAHPKILMGYSDVTALLNAQLAQNHIIAFHGPDAARLAKNSAGDNKAAFALLQGETPFYNLETATVLKPGVANGPLIGGNLCILNYLMGTAYAPAFNNALLFIEDELEELRNIDRMLLNLRRLGRLDQVSGLMVGGFTMTLNGGRVPFPYDVRDLIEEHTQGLDIPVIIDAPFGHGEDLPCFPVGGQARLTATKDHIALELTESAVSV